VKLESKQETIHLILYASILHQKHHTVQEWAVIVHLLTMRKIFDAEHQPLSWSAAYAQRSLRLQYQTEVRRFKLVSCRWVYLTWSIIAKLL